MEQLRDRDVAWRYLMDILDSGDVRTFPRAARDVAQALTTGGLNKRAKLARETLDEALSKRRNPAVNTVAAVLASVGFELTIESKDV